MADLQQVHVRVNDAATGKPTPCRVRFTDAEGRYYAPYGRLTEFSGFPVGYLGGNVRDHEKRYAYIDGTCEIALPPGKVVVEVEKGLEYKPLRFEHQLIQGKMALRLTLERWINTRERGWLSGDARVHYLSPQAALLEGMAEDVAIVNLLARQDAVFVAGDRGTEGTERTGRWQPAISNLLEFSGQQPAVEKEGCMVVV